MADWIDEEKSRRDQGITPALSQEAHAAVNARYPGCTLEECSICGEYTGRAGIAEDSLYDDDGGGPYCKDCWHAALEARDGR